MRLGEALTVANIDSRQRTRKPPVDRPLIDADTHNAFPTKDLLKRYLAPKWHPYHDQGLSYGTVYGGVVLGARPHRIQYSLETLPASGIGGSDLALMREQLLDGYNVGKAILHPSIEYSHLPSYGEVGHAMMGAVNDWMVDQWLDADSRLYGGISIPLEDGPRAAREIHRAAQHPRFVKVVLPDLTREPLGDPKYWPIYEAAVAHRLPVVTHPGGFSGTCLATGWPGYYIESHAGSFPQAVYAQVVSLTCSGVFDEFPDLKFVLEESGISWIVALMARMDRAWESWPEYLPHLERRPSEIVREHFWVTTQPVEEPGVASQLLDVLHDLAMDDRILFSSDYPHWDYDDPHRVLPRSLIAGELREKIFVDNAAALFNFPA